MLLNRPAAVIQDHRHLGGHDSGGQLYKIDRHSRALAAIDFLLRAVIAGSLGNTRCHALGRVIMQDTHDETFLNGWLYGVQVDRFLLPTGAPPPLLGVNSATVIGRNPRTGNARLA